MSNHEDKQVSILNIVDVHEFVYKSIKNSVYANVHYSVQYSFTTRKEVTRRQWYAFNKTKLVVNIYYLTCQSSDK